MFQSPGAESATINTIAMVFSGIVLLAFWRDMNDFKRKVERWQTRIETALFGPDGRGGVHDDVRELKHVVKELDKDPKRRGKDDTRE